MPKVGRRLLSQTRAAVEHRGREKARRVRSARRFQALLAALISAWADNVRPLLTAACVASLACDGVVAITLPDSARAQAEEMARALLLNAPFERAPLVVLVEERLVVDAPFVGDTADASSARRVFVALARVLMEATGFDMRAVNDAHARTRVQYITAVPGAGAQRYHRDGLFVGCTLLIPLVATTNTTSFVLGSHSTTPRASRTTVFAGGALRPGDILAFLPTLVHSGSALPEGAAVRPVLYVSVSWREPRLLLQRHVQLHLPTRAQLQAWLGALAPVVDFQWEKAAADNTAAHGTLRQVGELPWVRFPLITGGGSTLYQPLALDAPVAAMPALRRGRRSDVELLTLLQPRAAVNERAAAVKASGSSK